MVPRARSELSGESALGASFLRERERERESPLLRLLFETQLKSVGSPPTRARTSASCESCSIHFGISILFRFEFSYRVQTRAVSCFWGGSRARTRKWAQRLSPQFTSLMVFPKDSERDWRHEREGMHKVPKTKADIDTAQVRRRLGAWPLRARNCTFLFLFVRESLLRLGSCDAFHERLAKGCDDLNAGARRDGEPRARAGAAPRHTPTQTRPRPSSKNTKTTHRRQETRVRGSTHKSPSFRRSSCSCRAQGSGA